MAGRRTLHAIDEQYLLTRPGKVKHYEAFGELPGIESSLGELTSGHGAICFALTCPSELFARGISGQERQSGVDQLRCEAHFVT